MHQALTKLLISKVTLYKSHIEQASTSQGYIRNLLDNKSRENNDLPWVIDDFLSGSYARRIKIHPLDDIDIMVVLDGQGLFPTVGGEQLNAKVNGRVLLNNPVYKHTNEDGTISSLKILEVFRKHLKTTFPNSEIKKDGQAINVYFDSYKMGLDIVPCFHILPSDSTQDYYYIPQGRGSNMWISTNPKIDAAICDSLNDKFGKKLKPIIRLVKYWNQTQNYGRLKSYHVEVIVWKVFQDYPREITNYAVALRYFFNNADKYILEACEDPTRLGGNIDSYLDESVASRRLTLLKINEAKGALASSNVLMPLASQLTAWRKVFGPELCK